MKYFNEDKLSAYDSKVKAQFISFAPITFQASKLLRDYGILSLVQEVGKKGVSIEQIQASFDQIPEYGIKVLVEAGLGIGLLFTKEDKFYLTKLGFFIQNDPMTRVNMDFTNDICYQGIFDLNQAIAEGKPSGLKKLGVWKTVYEGLSQLTSQQQKSWFDFDHYYSDIAFPKAISIVFQNEPKKILDIGGNTGKWASLCVQQNESTIVTIVDLPSQIEMAVKNLEAKKFKNRIDSYAMNILNPDKELPKGYDVIWMSQFLDCFSQEDIVTILKKSAKAMTGDTRLFILETYWDRQENETAAFCLQQTSLYFTCIANGNSQMYHSNDMKNCIREAGLEVVAEHDLVGLYHTLLECRI